MTELLWFMALWPPTDRPIKCFSNITIPELINCQIELTAMCNARVLRRGQRSKTKLTALAPLRQSTFWILLLPLLIVHIFTGKKNCNKIETGFVAFIFWERGFFFFDKSAPSLLLFPLSAFRGLGRYHYEVGKFKFITNAKVAAVRRSRRVLLSLKRQMIER